MVFKILRKDSVDYKSKLKKLKDLQIILDAKRWAAITERADHSAIAEKLNQEFPENSETENLNLIKKVKEHIESENPDLKLVQGNLELSPALKLLEIQSNPTKKSEVKNHGRSV